MSAAAAQEVLASARYGDADDIRELLRAAATPEEKDALVNYVQDGSLNTPLHMGELSLVVDTHRWWCQV